MKNSDELNIFTDKLNDLIDSRQKDMIEYLMLSKVSETVLYEALEHTINKADIAKIRIDLLCDKSENI